MQSQDTPFDAFPEDVRTDVDGLIWLGYLEESFSYCGHDFVLRTLRGDEELLAALVTKDYAETVGQAKAQIWATIALALVSIDGAEDFCPPATANKRDFARARFQWLATNWLWPTALAIYTRYQAMIDRQREALEALDSFCSGSLPTPTPTASSSTDKAPSEHEIMEFLEPPEGSTPSS